jgi:hypothetical protein
MPAQQPVNAAAAAAIGANDAQRQLPLQHVLNKARTILLFFHSTACTTVRFDSVSHFGSYIGNPFGEPMTGSLGREKKAKHNIPKRKKVHQHYQSSS